MPERENWYVFWYLSSVWRLRYMFKLIKSAIVRQDCCKYFLFRLKVKNLLRVKTPLTFISWGRPFTLISFLILVLILSRSQLWFSNCWPSRLCGLYINFSFLGFLLASTKSFFYFTILAWDDFWLLFEIKSPHSEEYLTIVPDPDPTWTQLWYCDSNPFKFARFCIL